MPAALRAAIFTIPLLVAYPALGDRQAEDAELKAALTAEYQTKGLEALEPSVIAASNGRARRDGATLTLAIQRGPAIKLTDDRSGCESPKFDEMRCYGFSLVADMPSRHAYLVADISYEGGTVALIDSRTGTQAQFSEIPRFSPDGKLLLVISNDAGSDAGLIQLWSREDDVVTKIWQVPAAQAGEQTRFIAWTAEGIHLDLWHSASDKTPEHHRSAVLAHSKSGWNLTFAGY